MLTFDKMRTSSLLYSLNRNFRYNAHAHGSIAGGDTAHGKGGHSTALQMLGDPFRVGKGEDMMRDRGCMELSFMHPRLLRDVPFGDLGATPHLGRRPINF